MKYKYIIVVLSVIFMIGIGILPSVSAIQYDETVSISQSDTFQKVENETYTVSYVNNETGENVTETRTSTSRKNVDLIEIRDVTMERVGNAQSDEPAEKVRSRIEIYPSELGQRIIEDESLDSYQMNGEPISASMKDQLDQEMSDLSISYAIGSSGENTERPINAKNGKTYTIVSNLDNGRAQFDIGSRTTTITIDSQAEWNDNGTHSRTSADRNDNSGNLGLGYPNNASWVGDIGLFYRVDTFQTNDGATITDYSGNGEDGILDFPLSGTDDVNNPSSTFSTDGIETVINSDNARNDGVRIRTDDGVDSVSDNVTVSMWVNYNSFNTGESGGTDRQVPWVHGTGQSNDGNIRITGDGSVNIYNSGTLSDTGFDLSLNTWQHFVVSYDTKNDFADIYVDGSRIGGQSYTVSGNVGSLMNTNMTFLSSIGTSYGQENSEGIFDEMMIIDSHLSQSEIEELYLQGQSGPFNGNYESDNLRSTKDTTVQWNELNVSATTNNQDVNATVEVSDDDFATVLDSQTYTNIVNGLNTFNLSTLQNADDIKVSYDFTSSNEEETSTISSYNVGWNETTTTQPNISVSQSVPSTWTLGNTTVSHTVNGKDVSDMTVNITINDVLMNERVYVGSTIDETFNETYEVNETHITNQNTGFSVGIQDTNTYNLSAYDQGSTENVSVQDTFKVDDGTQPTNDYQTPSQETILLFAVLIGTGLFILTNSTNPFTSFIGGFFIMASMVFAHIENVLYDEFTIPMLIIGFTTWIISIWINIK